MLFDRWIVASKFLDPGSHPLQCGFRCKALASSSGTHEQRLDLPKLLAQLRLAGHSDPRCPLRTGINPSSRAGGVNHPDRADQSIPHRSSPGTGDPLVTLTEHALRAVGIA
ncbi:hypothetical protein [Bradyrhizobium pachyrhizi]|uniref:hypothetical protein n=1 Tax=Bradyrhizobium pachyrhizi TaxID=280333 RepID=UPI001FD5AB3E|nr:hypothetical protein [Bradyrhizobium pachyrhizi]